MSNTIIIIGGGYAGLRTVEHLAQNPENEIILFDKNPYHFMQTDVYDLIANETDFAQVTVDLCSFCMGFDENVTFYKQEVSSIDFSHKKVITQTQRYSYDYLVIAVGARTKFNSEIQGLREYGYGVKALHRAMFFKQKFEMSLFDKVNTSGSYCKPINIIVAGAGLSGVEIATQMASFAKEFYYQNNFLCRKLNIVIVNSGREILQGMESYFIRASQKRLDTLEVLIKHEQKVVALSTDTATLSNGNILPMDFLIYAGGIEPSTLVYALDCKKDRAGYILTNACFQVLEHEGVYAIGDCAKVQDDTYALAPTADIAEQMADLCAKNIQNDINSLAQEKHSIQARGVLIALGRNYAVAKVFGFYFKGIFAFYVKKMIEKVYAKRLDRRSNKGCKKIFTQ